MQGVVMETADSPGLRLSVEIPGSGRSHVLQDHQR